MISSADAPSVPALNKPSEIGAWLRAFQCVSWQATTATSLVHVQFQWEGFPVLHHAHAALGRKPNLDSISALAYTGTHCYRFAPHPRTQDTRTRGRLSALGRVWPRICHTEPSCVPCRGDPAGLQVWMCPGEPTVPCAPSPEANSVTYPRVDSLSTQRPPGSALGSEHT